MSREGEAGKGGLIDSDYGSNLVTVGWKKVDSSKGVEVGRFNQVTIGCGKIRW